MKINNWRLWLGIGISLFFLLLLAYNVDLNEIATSLAEANYWYAIPAIGLYFVAVSNRPRSNKTGADTAAKASRVTPS